MRFNRQPRVVVIGGPNGAGKTTTASVLLPEDLAVTRYVNADVIARGLAGFAPETVALQAGRIMLTRLAELAAERQDFAFETTLAARSFVPFLARLRDDGYLANVTYIWISSPELCIERVALRVRRGGHHVPEEVVRRRYWRGLDNFRRLYRPVADSWVLCDNSGDEPRVVARGGRDQDIEILDEACYEQVERQHQPD